MRVYVASSWRCDRQRTVAALRAAGHEVYDFRRPPDGSDGFHWTEVDPTWGTWNADDARAGLSHPIAREGFARDLAAMEWADACVHVVPGTAGRSSHLEAGWFAGRPDKHLVVLLTDGEPELMYSLADAVCVSMAEVLRALTRLQPWVYARAVQREMELRFGGHQLTHEEEGRIRALFEARLAGAGPAARRLGLSVDHASGRVTIVVDDRDPAL